MFKFLAAVFVCLLLSMPAQAAWTCKLTIVDSQVDGKPLINMVYTNDTDKRVIVETHSFSLATTTAWITNYITNRLEELEELDVLIAEVVAAIESDTIVPKKQ